MLKCDRLVPQDGKWNSNAAYTVAGAKVMQVRIDALANTLTLTTDKAWKPGETVTLTYPRFPSTRASQCARS